MKSSQAPRPLGRSFEMILLFVVACAGILLIVSQSSLLQ
jgi:hypothetical protein